MRRFPEAIQNATAALSRLPGVGPKTALRYVFFLLKQPKADLQMMAKMITDLGDKVKVCNQCFAYTEYERCEICQDAKRDQNLLCVIEESRDIATIEATDIYPGLYHVLGGTLNPIEGMTPEVLKIQELVARLRANPQIKEIILAFSPDVHGETTMMYLAQQLAEFPLKITRLARGLPTGASLEYADEVTLGDALKGRREA
ncbi:recombination mediator RecR [Patescibacteria group bacterium]|nr:recombination mediator RecR [Patescibacteria group bacterium]MBU1705917.1 recombination mediator RecR [Patescibacteria group bacterium]